MRNLWMAVAIGILVASGWSGRPVAQAQQSFDPVALDPQHYKLEFENEYVRVIRCRIPPHDKVGMHRHPVNGVMVLLGDQNMRSTTADGTVREAHRKAGETYWMEAVTHRGENISDTPFEYVRVDIKAAK